MGEVPFAAQRHKASIDEDNNLPIQTLNAKLAAHVFEKTCLGAVMHQGSVSASASDLKLNSQSISTVKRLAESLFGLTVKNAWSSGVSRDRTASDEVWLLEFEAPACAVFVISANFDQAVKEFFELMDFQKKQGVQVNRLTNAEIVSKPDSRTVLRFTSTPPNTKYYLAWDAMLTNSKNAVQLIYLSSFRDREKEKN